MNEIKRPNDEGKAACIIRYEIETDKGWIGSWDKEALEQIIIPQKAGLRNFEKKFLIRPRLSHVGSLASCDIIEVEVFHGPDENGNVCILKQGGYSDRVHSRFIFDTFEQARSSLKETQ